MGGLPFMRMPPPAKPRDPGQPPAARPAAAVPARQPAPRPEAPNPAPRGILGKLGALSGAQNDHESHHPGPTGEPAESPAAAPGAEEVSGRIVRLIFQAADSGYAVYAVQGSLGKEFTLSVTSSVKANKGDKIIARGAWGEYKGRETFKALMLMHDIPKGAKGVVAWLKSGAVAGVGKGTAQKIAKHFGDSLEEAVESAERLVQAGIPFNRAEAIAEAWNSNANQPALIAYLAKIGLGEAAISKVIRRYGAASKKVIAENPWVLCETIDGVGFATADDIALRNGHAKDSAARIKAALGHVLTEKTNRDGHSGLPKEELIEAAASLLKLPQVTVSQHVEAFFSGFAYTFDQDVGLAYTQAIHSAERRLAERIVSMARGDGRGMLTREAAEPAIDRAAAEIGISLDPSQRDAALRALTSGISVITGGPGTGKSTIQRVVVGVLREFAREVALASPTGRAAKRLAEVTGMPASTCHRLLQFSIQKGGFEFDRENPLPEDWLIVDEFSMVDVRLGASFFDAIGDEACTTLVGDIDQLPSVGSGQVLRDLITSGAIPVSRLTQAHRQGKDSGIIPAAHRINSGLHPFQDPEEILKGFEIHDMSDSEAMVKKVLQLLKHELPERGINPIRDVQVLAAMRRGDVGVHALNDAIKAALNPARGDTDTVELRKKPFTVGDRVMQLRNDYAKGVYNGEVGSVSWVGYQRGENGEREAVVKVDYSGYMANYTAADVADIEQAWAATVHKSQGCEFPVVIFLCPYEHRRMLNRNLLYTAVTRAKAECYIVGDDAAVLQAVETEDAHRRWTGLAERLRADAPDARLAAEAADLDMSFGA